MKDKGSEVFPATLAHRLCVNRENPTLVFREYRNLTQSELADKVSVSQPHISRIESGNYGSIPVMKRIAEDLNVTVDDLI